MSLNLLAILLVAYQFHPTFDWIDVYNIGCWIWQYEVCALNEVGVLSVMCTRINLFLAFVFISIIYRWFILK